MSEYKKIAILGAGAVGSYMLWGLSNRDDIDLCVVAQGERKQRLETEGLTINDVHYQPKVCTPEEAKGVDLLFVTVKYTALMDALEDIEIIVTEQTTVLSLLNGVDSEEIIGSRIGAERVMPSLIKVASERRGNTVRFDPVTTIGLIYGEADPKASQERVEGLDALFEGTGLNYRATDNILTEIWSKFLLNVGNNQIQAILSCGVGAYTDSAHAAYLKEKLREEVIAIAAAKGIDLASTPESSARGSKVMPRARYSTLQDLDAGRHTEVDVFAGAVMKMGEQLHIPTPYNEMTYHLIKALEEKNDGLFDYD